MLSWIASVKRYSWWMFRVNVNVYVSRCGCVRESVWRVNRRDVHLCVSVIVYMNDVCAHVWVIAFVRTNRGVVSRIPGCSLERKLFYLQRLKHLQKYELNAHNKRLQIHCKCRVTCLYSFLGTWLIVLLMLAINDVTASRRLMLAINDVTASKRLMLAINDVTASKRLILAIYDVRLWCSLGGVIVFVSRRDCVR